jgi:hypothetical protein
MRCVSCGAELPNDALFCGQCGADRPRAVQPMAAPPYAPQPMAAGLPATPGAMAICTSCGVIAPSARQSCAVCNASLAARAPVSDPPTGFWTGVECRFRCTACGHESPINHLDFDGSVMCLRCGIDQRFDREQWVEALEHAHAVGDLCGPNPQGRFSSGAPLASNQFARLGVEHTFAETGQRGVVIDASGMSHRSLTIKAMPGHPLCSKCKSLLAVQNAAPGVLDVACTRCPERKRYEWPVDVVNRVSSLSGVVCDEHEHGGHDAQVLQDASGAVAIRCPNCSAPLPVGEHTVVHCGYCGIAVRIPAPTLRGLGHANPKTELWWLYFRGPSKERGRLEQEARSQHLEAQRAAERDRQRRLEPAFLPPSGTPGARKSQAATLIAIPIVMLVIIGGAAAAWLTRGAPRRDATTMTAASATAVATAAPAPPAPKLSLAWNGKVSRAQGSALKKGARCAVKLQAEGPKIQWLTATCGDERLYDSRTPLNGMSMSSSALGEAPHADHPGSYGYAVLFNDTGQRTGRAQIQLDTTHGQASVFSDAIPQFRVDIAIDTVSEPRTGEPIYRTPKHAASVALDLRVASATGAAPIKSGQACRLELKFANSLPGVSMCSASVTCGKTWVYGKKTQAGFVVCTLDAAGSPLGGSDKQPPSADKTPELEVDVTKGTATLKSSEDDYSVVLSRSPG